MEPAASGRSNLVICRVGRSGVQYGGVARGLQDLCSVLNELNVEEIEMAH